MPDLKRLLLPAAVTAAVGVAVNVAVSDLAIEVQPVVLDLSDLPDAFVGYRVAVVSDVHLPRSARFLRRLIDLVAAQKPDAVWIAGDLVNRHDTLDTAGLKTLARGLAAIAPCFAVHGNHELRHPESEAAFDRILTDAGILVLRDEPMTVGRDGAFITLYGVSRRVPLPQPDHLPRPIIALAHHPEYAEQYAAAGFDAAVCGHAHGGQIRLGAQGIYSPGQGILPRYTSGAYAVGDMTLVVSRGLGNGSCPVRLGNRLHLPVLFLSRKDG